MGRPYFRDGYRFWTPEEISTLRRLYPLATKATILEAINRPWSSIREAAHKRGIQRLDTSKKRQARVE